MRESETDGPTKGIKSIERAFAIVETIRDGAPKRASEIADQLDCSQSTIHYHLKTMENCGYLTCTDEGYILGLRFLHLGGHSLISRGLYGPLNNELAQLAVEVGESVQVAVEEKGRGYYVEQVSGSQLSGTSRHVGTEMYLHSTAGGKAILANLSPERVNEIIQTHSLPQFTENTVTKRSALVEELQEIEDRGIAFEVQETETGLSGMAAPLQRNDGIVGSIELTLPATRIPDPRYSRKEERFPSGLVDRLESHSKRIEDRLSDK